MSKARKAPQGHWLPLRLAPFFYRALPIDAGTLGPGSTLEVLEELLLERSGAVQVRIDPPSGTFMLLYSGDSGAQAYGGPPWALLTDRPVPAETPLDQAEALFDPNVRTIDDEVARQQVKEFRSVQAAVGLVWRQFMLCEFDRILESGEVFLFARKDHPTAGFEEIPYDVWRLHDVADWENGTMVGPGDSRLFSVHAGKAQTNVNRGAPPKADWDAVDEAIRQEVETRGLPERDGEKGWKTQADVERFVFEFLDARKEPVGASTVKLRVQMALRKLREKGTDD